ncbi:hypothetical protein DW943_04895 [Collinsella sp. AM44-11]|nr:hypothetical protein DW943_04895 [Collinsella sp. AM44-11]
MRYAYSGKAKAEALWVFGLFAWSSIELQTEHKSAKAPLSEQGDVKEEGSVFGTRPTIERQIAA